MHVHAATKSVSPACLNRPHRKPENDTSVLQAIRVLLVDDNDTSARLLGDSLAQAGCACVIASKDERALEVVRSLDCDVVICDVHTLGGSDFALLKQIKTLRPNLPVIVRAANGSIVEAIAAVKHGAFQYVAKSLDNGDILGFVAQATADANQSRNTTRPPPSVLGGADGQLEHESPAMRELVDSIGLVARSDTPVLILGESGTGKERVARAIHAGGFRASQPYVAINTSAIPEQLLESEIFGHVRGAFTGATQARRGLLLEAHGGTLLLDEIGDMPILLQPKLLRVLQFGESRPVGSDRVGHVDVRVIAATHRDLNALVAQGRFREDLRYRLNVIPLVVPPLRHRREDIRPLVAQFLAEARSRTVESPVRSISDEAMNVLIEAAWPGNVRELENAIERLVVLGRQASVTVRDLGFLQPHPSGEGWEGFEGSSRTLKQMNRRYLEWVLARTEGDKVRAAKILDVNLSTLYRWERAKN